MKVTVYFGNVRVIVPCGNGDILVRDLMDLAITRYKKATGKSQSSVVTIHNLKSSRDDGILYPDDQLNDVADDREQIIAVFDENYSPIPQYNCGDVTSTSSVYTGSPDLFSVEVGSLCSNNNVDAIEDPHLPGVTPLQVRRGSEPALNCLFPPISSSSTDPNNKRWSTAVVINAPDHQQDANENGVDESVSPLESLDLNGDSKMSSLSFSRSSGRLSILGNNSETHRWVEAADRQLMKDFNESFRLKSPEHRDEADSDTSSMSDEREKTIILKNETGPLGIHVVPDYDSSGRDTGLVIQGIEEGGRIDRDGRFCVGDRITEINGKSLQNVSFQTAQEIFKSALKSSQIKLELIRGASNHLQQSKTAAIPKKPPAPIYPRATTPSEVPKKPEEESSLVEGEERAGGVSTKVATVTPTKKIPASATRRLASANTRKIGKMLTIELTKGSAGLGFSITTRDNPAGGNSPIYIKNILPKGAAIEDGRLLPGDRLLEVNGISMTNKTQSDAVSILRNIPLGKTVQLIVSRQEAVEPDAATEVESEPVQQPKLDDETGIFPWKYREILTFQIPLNESHSAGLGVSVKGKTASTPNGSVDLGIFIKSVIPGGAASKDGRLQTNDQLVNINGISLLGMSNTNAMETLRNAMMRSDGPIRNAIILTVARRIFQPLEEENSAKPEIPSVPKEGMNGLDLHKNNSLDLDTLQKNNPGLPGCNPVVERLTGQLSAENSASDLYGYMRRGTDKTSYGMEEHFKPNYMSSLNSNQAENVIIEGEYDPTVKKIADTPQMNGTTNNSNVAPASSQLSLDDPNAGFERDGFGRQSMSEKRHAQLDAKNTDTYQRNKKAREEREHKHYDDEEEVNHVQRNPITGSGSTLIHHNNQADEALGPSLGLRKSSSLESLQTMIQELNKDDEAMKRALKSGGARSSRSRGCNESFRAAVDRSYDAPAASTMDTLDEESESGSSVGHLLTRSTEFPDAHPHNNLDGAFQDDLLSMYCRNSKSSKKKSLLKGLGSVFKFGKHRKHSQDLKGKGDDDSGHEEYYHQQPSSSKESDRMSEMSREDLLKRQLPQIPNLESTGGMPNRQERMQSLREQHQRMHQKRQGQYPLEQKEEYYENELKEKEGNYALPFEVIHGRSHSLDIHLENSQNHLKGAAHGDPNRYSHYMNYKEIQQHFTQRGHPAASKSTSVPDSKPHGAPLPELPATTNFYEYSTHHLRRTGQNPEVCSNSLPRGVRGSDRSLPHPQVPASKPYFLQEAHDHDNYGRMNVHQFYPNNNKLYSHIVPGSKV